MCRRFAVPSSALSPIRSRMGESYFWGSSRPTFILSQPFYPHASRIFSEVAQLCCFIVNFSSIPLPPSSIGLQVGACVYAHRVAHFLNKQQII